MKYFIGILITFFLATLAHAQQTIDKLKVKDLELPSESASRALLIDSSKKVKASSTVSDTELSYLDGVTSAIQTQLNGKEPSITTLSVAKGGTNSGTSLNNNRVMQSSGGAIVEAAAITASRAVVSDANGIPTHSTVTSTEVGYLSGVTSNIQTQINAISGAFTPVVVIAKTNAGQTINTTPATIVYEDEQVDSATAYDTTTGIFTVPTTGQYLVCCSMSAQTNLSTSQNQFIRIMRAGSGQCQDTVAGNGASSEKTSNACCIVDASASDQILCEGYSDVSDTLEAVQAKNSLSIERVR